MNSDNFYAVTKFSSYAVGSEDHGFLGEFVEYDDVLKAVKEWAELNDWYPDLYFISDHGNIDSEPTNYMN